MVTQDTLRRDFREGKLIPNEVVRSYISKDPNPQFLRSQLYRLTYALTHIIFGIVVRLLQACHAVVDRVLAMFYHHHRTPELIRKDVRGLRRLPEHLSVILTLQREEDALAVLMDDVAELAAWSSCAGILQLSVYEKTGVLKSQIPKLHQSIVAKLGSYYGSLEEHPDLVLFAPHHECTRSANRRKHTLIIRLLSSTDGRETVVDLTKTLAEMSQNGKLSSEKITPELVDAEVTDATAKPLDADADADVVLKPEPDLLLVFGPFLKLDGYPPWQIRLTEMYCTGAKSHGVNGEAVEYQGFITGLWHFAGAQMRFGR